MGPMAAYIAKPSRWPLFENQHQQQNAVGKIATNSEEKRSRKELNEGKESCKEKN